MNKYTPNGLQACWSEVAKSPKINYIKWKEILQTKTAFIYFHNALHLNCYQRKNSFFPRDLKRALKSLRFL